MLEDSETEFSDSDALSARSESSFFLTSSLAVSALISFLFAIFPRLTIGSQTLLDPVLPEFIRNVWSVFRTSGRTIWTVVYALMIFSVLVCAVNLNENAAKMLCLCVLLIQVYDMHGRLNTISESFPEQRRYESRLTEAGFWDSFQENGVRHVIFGSEFEPMVQNLDIVYAITDWAMNNGMTLNEFYFARPIDESVEEYRQAAYQDAADDTVFVFKNPEYCAEYGLNCYAVDGLTVGYSKAISGYETVNDNYSEAGSLSREKMVIYTP